MQTGKILLTGANRGIGLELTRRLVALDFEIHACHRQGADTSALDRIGEGVHRHVLDVTNESQRAALKEQIADEPLDFLINNAGIYGRDQDFGSIDADAWIETLRVNTIAPVLMCETFAENVARSTRKVICNMSSLMGSIDDNSSGGSYAYRTSKTALNMATKSLSIDLAPRGITVCVFHPGWVRTDMGGAGAPLSPEESAHALVEKMLTLSAPDSGKFFRYNGEVIPW